MYTNVDVTVMNGKGLKFKDRITESNPDIVGVTDTKLMKEV